MVANDTNNATFSIVVTKQVWYFWGNKPVTMVNDIVDYFAVALRLQHTNSCFTLLQ